MTKANLYQKIRAVMQDVQYLAKDDHIRFENINYRAISEEKVTSTVRESLIKNGLIILPVKQDHKREGTLSTVDTTYKIIDTETGEHELIVSSGTGVDTQDKGVGKAMTYSYKYLFLRTFAIPTGEDPDKVSSAELDDKEKQPKNNPNIKPSTPEQIGFIQTMAIQFAKLKGGQAEEIYDVFKKSANVSELNQLSFKQAEAYLAQLRNWVDEAKRGSQSANT